MLQKPTGIYVNWAAYDELSDNVELTEDLALRQLGELSRLRRHGVQIDYYLMDAFWYSPDGGYRTWRAPHWPAGPDRWLEACSREGVKPGLWVTANALCKMDRFPAWADSLDPVMNAYCCFAGGFMPHFMETLHIWYGRGVRMFKFDFANFDAAPPALKRAMLPSEIRASNVAAWRGAMAAFKAAHPEVILLAYNGYEEIGIQQGTSAQVRKAVDLRWLDVFDAMYCGDPRPADVPMMSFWRSKDVYSDHMVRFYLANNLPAARIDNSAFMVGVTGTCYKRGVAAWQGMLLLSLARGGWANTYYGNLDLLDNGKAEWFARAQSLYMPLQAVAEFRTLGGMPGEAMPYGYVFCRDADAVVTVVNPGQCVGVMPLSFPGPARIIFRDAGFEPRLQQDGITLGPEQMVVIGYGRYSAPTFDLGVQQDVRIPRTIDPITAWESSQANAPAVTTVPSPRDGTLRVVFQQKNGGVPVRSSGGAPPAGVSMGRLLEITMAQEGRVVPAQINYDKAIWSGLSWAVAEADAADLKPGEPVTITCSSKETRPVRLECRAFHVRY